MGGRANTETLWMRGLMNPGLRRGNALTPCPGHSLSSDPLVQILILPELRAGHGAAHLESVLRQTVQVTAGEFSD